ncbi:helix-turn-helix domain-containing protein [Priestia koreensis]|uniref:helix-turn-helix domain-containing protein n=1 Tax=Priestia koreensis TaxID=284581 RepID=UPI0020421581|nr:helix-turn-helix transcriptional regulator [Priestia koreensis]MCM3003659.1 helix-turn-helix transcriptional regulator [Priestia koreensis]
MKIEEAFGVILKKYRMKLELSQEELALRSELDRTYISLLERGKRKPTINTIFSLSKELSINPNKLIEEVEKLLKS